MRDLIRQIAMEHELEVISGKVARDHVHVFVSYRTTQDVSQVVQWLKGISSRVLLQEFPHLKKMFWGRHFWARGYLAVSSGTITDEMIKEYIDEQEGEQIADDSRFPIDKPQTPRLPGEGCLVSCHCRYQNTIDLYERGSQQHAEQGRKDAEHQRKKQFERDLGCKLFCSQLALGA